MDNILNVWASVEEQFDGRCWIDPESPLPTVWVRSRIHRCSVGFVLSSEILVSESSRIESEYKKEIRWFWCRVKVLSESHTKYLRTTWADVLLYFLPMANTFSSKMNLGVCSWGLGRPRGEKAATAISCFLQNSINLLWLRAGENSTWFMTGLMVHPFNMWVICSLLKLERPMLRTSPFSTSFSIALYVSSMSMSSLYNEQTTLFKTETFLDKFIFLTSPKRPHFHQPATNRCHWCTGNWTANESSTDRCSRDSNCSAINGTHIRLCPDRESLTITECNHRRINWSLLSKH